MNGWTRLWFVITLTISAAVAGIQACEWHEARPKVHLFYQPIADQLALERCTKLKGAIFMLRSFQEAFFALWIGFFVVRPVVRWIARGFGHGPKSSNR